MLRQSNDKGVNRRIILYSFVNKAFIFALPCRFAEA